MAGGMGKGRGPTLAERSAAAVVSGGAATGNRRHCWVVDAPGHPGRYPGLLAEWRRERDGWQGRVVYALDEPDGGCRLVERWVPAACLEAT
jgi:hypothetical protein